MTAGHLYLKPASLAKQIDINLDDFHFIEINVLWSLWMNYLMTLQHGAYHIDIES